MHLQSGGPKQHTASQHNAAITRRILEENTRIIRRESDPQRLAIYEALLILQTRTIINDQDMCFNRTLKLFYSMPPPEQRRNPPEPLATDRTIPQPSSPVQSSARNLRPVTRHEVPLRRSARIQNSQNMTNLTPTSTEINQFIRSARMQSMYTNNHQSHIISPTGTNEDRRATLRSARTNAPSS